MKMLSYGAAKYTKLGQDLTELQSNTDCFFLWTTAKVHFLSIFTT